MTVVSNDPSLWPLITLYRVASYFVGSWRTSRIVSVMSHPDFDWFHSCILYYGDIRLGWAKLVFIMEIINVSCSLAALTFVQEVGWCYYGGNWHLTKFLYLVRIDLGEQSCMLSSALMLTNSGQRQRWSLITFLYVSVRIFYVSLIFAAGKSCWLENLLVTLPWNCIRHVCMV
jgi:hypothetical protein